jgi:hypothetical protein
MKQFTHFGLCCLPGGKGGSRVTGLGDFSTIGQLLLAVFFKSAEIEVRAAFSTEKVVH